MSDDMNKLQLLEQNLQNYLNQRQQYQSQLVEIDSALGELSKTDSSYRIIGNIMVKRDPKELEKDLSEKKEKVELKIKSLEKQEGQLREKAKELQQKIMNNMGD